MTLESGTVNIGDTATASQYNDLRKDMVEHAGETETSTGSANAYVVTTDSQVDAYFLGLKIVFKANFSNTAAATVNVNSLGAKTIKKNVDEDLSADDIKDDQIVTLIYDGTYFQLASSPASQPLHIIQFAFGSSTDLDEDDRWMQLFDNNQKALKRDPTTATTLNYYPSPTPQSVFLGNDETDRTSLTINLDIGCMVKDGATEYLIAAADGGTSVYRYDNDGQNETLCTFSGTSPTAIRRMGYDVANGYVWIMDGSNKAATQIRRYTFSGSTLTNIDSDITLGTAPSNAGSGNILIGPTYAVMQDTASSPYNLVRYNKSSGTKIDDTTITAQTGAGEFFRGIAISSDNKLYLIIACTSGSPGMGYLALYDCG